MKLGTQTASVINHLHARAVIGQPEPKAGMGATILCWSDRRPATVFRVFSHGKRLAIEVRDDDYKLVSGSAMSEAQSYEFKTNLRGRRSYFIRDDNGFWREAYFKSLDYTADGQAIKSSRLSVAKKGQGHGLRLGARDCYSDPTF
jgi:hypothetical protein